LLIRPSQEDILTIESHPPPSKKYTRVIQEAIDLKGGDYKQGDLVLVWDTKKGQLNTHKEFEKFWLGPYRIEGSLSMIPTIYPHIGKEASITS
jgi:hypothetical protein